MKIKTFLLLLLTAFLSWTCSEKDKLVDKNRLTGRYIIQTHKLDTVDINSDGTFIRYYEKEKLTGKWTYDSITGYLKLEDFWYSNGDWHTKVRQKENEIHLIYATDISGGYYLRIDSTDRKRIE
jgi:hypothetical protein